jgi:hypothetical protein
MEAKIKRLGVELNQTIVKTTESVRKNNNNQITSIKEVIETMDELGKKQAKLKTTRFSYDKEGNLSDTKVSTVNISTNEAARIKVKEYTNEIGNLTAQYNKLSREGKLTTTNIYGIISSLDDVIKKYDLTGVSLDKVTKIQDRYNKKVLELQNPGVSASKVDNYKNSAASKLDSIQTSYNENRMTGQDRIDFLKNQTKAVQDVINAYKLEGKAETSATAQKKRYNDEVVRLTENLKTQAEQQKKNIRHQRYEYFTGKADPGVYIENPFPKKIRDKETLQGYLDSDEKLMQVSLKVEYYETMLSYIDSILKMIFNRTYQIKNSLEFMRFQSGLG